MHHPQPLIPIAVGQEGIAYWLERLDRLPDAFLLRSSGKLAVVVPLVEHLVRRDHQVIVFAHSLRMLRVVGELLRRRRIAFSEVNGGVPLAQRAEAVRRMQEREVRVMLITVTAGGEGITITAADSVIIMEPSWNPSVDEQAIHRACVVVLPSPPAPISPSVHPSPPAPISPSVHPSSPAPISPRVLC